MGKRHKVVPRCAVCGRPIAQTRHGYVHRSDKAADNGHRVQPMSEQ